MTVFLRKKIVIALILSLILSSFLLKDNVYAKRPEDKNLYSKACVLMDGQSGRILYGKNPQIPLANASTTKILTCIVALENGDLNGIVTISPNAVKQPKVHLGMKNEEQFYLKDLLYALMLESFNDCAVAIAEYISGTTEDFANLMNHKAEEIGCKDTYFITPNGLDAKDGKVSHHTTAEDLCRIMKYCSWESSQCDDFLEITETKEYAFTDLNGKAFHCNNHNAFLSMMDGVISGKTGFTGNAGYCYVASLEKDEKKFCIALLACGWPNNKTYKWSDAKKLLEYGLSDFKMNNLYKEIQLNPIYIENGKNPNDGIESWGTAIEIRPKVMVKKGETLNYLVAETDCVNRKVEFHSEIEAPLKENTVIGTYQIWLNNDCIKEYRICAGKAIERWNLWRLWKCLAYHYLGN